MRTLLLLATASTLAACSGGGPTTVGGNAPPQGPGGTPGQSGHSFVAPTVAKSYAGVGGIQTYDYTTDERNCCDQQGPPRYSADASTVRSSGINISYDPRDAIFTLVINDDSGARTDVRFQDPAHRTDFGGTSEPQWGAPNLANPNIRYLQSGDGNPISPAGHSGEGLVDPGDNLTPPSGDHSLESSYQSTTFFYEVPGSTTKYVTFAGYVRNELNFAEIEVNDAPLDQTKWALERGAFAYGEATPNNAVPRTGTGRYQGSMLATMVHNPTIDGANGAVLPTYFQWISGTSEVNVDFATSTVGVELNGTVFAPQIDRFTTPQLATVPAGASFTASGSGRIDLVNTGGFTGAFESAAFGATTNGAPLALDIAGSSVDGAFFGPGAEEVGGGFRIVGGTPDERIDILGAFTGAR